jgi:hypothetical protein
MREITNCQNGDQGAEPATGTNTPSENYSEIQENTEQCSVQTAKRLPRLADNVDVKVRGEWQSGYVYSQSENVDAFGEKHFRVWIEGGAEDEAVEVAADDEGLTWRFRAISAETKCEKHDEYRPCSGCECESDATHFEFEDTVKDAMKPAPEGRCEVCKVLLVAGDMENTCFVCHRFAQGKLQPETIPEEEEQPNDKQPPSPPVVRTCGVADCATILGDDCVEDMCSVHRRKGGACMRRGCERRRAKGSVWCTGHGKAAAAVDADFGEAPTLLAGSEDAQRDREEAFEDEWQALAEDSGNDPRTVARCKRIHDLQLRNMRRGG